MENSRESMLQCDGESGCNSFWKEKFLLLKQEYHDLSTKVYEEVETKFGLMEEQLKSYPELVWKVESLETNYRKLTRAKQQLQTEHYALVGEYSDHRDKFDSEVRKLLDEKRNLQEVSSKLQEQIHAQETEINQLKHQLQSANCRMSTLRDELDKSINSHLQVEETFRKFEIEKEEDVVKMKRENSEIQEKLGVLYKNKLSEAEVALSVLTAELIKSRKTNENLRHAILEKDSIYQQQIDDLSQRISDWKRASEEPTMQMSVELQQVREKLEDINLVCAKKDERYDELKRVAVTFLSNFTSTREEILNAFGIDQDHLKSRDVLLLSSGEGESDSRGMHILIDFQRADGDLHYFKSSLLWWKTEMETKLTKLRKKSALAEKRFASKRLSLMNEIGLTKGELATYKEVLAHLKHRLEVKIANEEKLIQAPPSSCANKLPLLQSAVEDNFMKEYKYLLDQAELIVNALDRVQTCPVLLKCSVDTECPEKTSHALFE